MTAILDSRYYDAVVFCLDSAAAQATQAGAGPDLATALARKLRAAGLRIGVASPGPAGGQNRGDATALLDVAAGLGVPPERCALVVDCEAALSGGRCAGFARVIAVDRTGRVNPPWPSGADEVVNDLAGVRVRAWDRRKSGLPDALQSYAQIAVAVSARRPVVLLDFDGTLSRIVDDPVAAAVDPGTVDALKLLAAQCDVVVLSGRDLSDLAPRVGVPGIWYAGGDGFEITAPEGTRHHHESVEAIADVLERAAAELRERFSSLDGIFVEQKRYTIAVHYRRAAGELVSEVTAAVRAVGHRLGLRIAGGRKLVELRPDNSWTKGKAVTWIVHRIGGADPVLPIYIGDDVSDEDAFDAVRSDGIGIAVRDGEDFDRPSNARFALDGPDAVRRFIERLTKDIATEREESQHSWSIDFEGYVPQDEPLREALCTVGNGYFATRGCAPESKAGGLHYAGTYAAGVYNRLSDHIDGTAVSNESLVNLPDWLPLTFRVNAGPWFDIDDVDLICYSQTLDLRRALLTRRFRFRDEGDRITAVTQQRFVAMHLPHVAASTTTVTAENWSGTIEFRSGLHGDVQNRQIERYRGLSGKHLRVIQLREISSNTVLLEAITTQSRIPIAVAARTTLWRGDEAPPTAYRLMRDAAGTFHPARIGHDITTELAAGQSVTLEKVAVIVTGRDPAVSEPADAAERQLNSTGRVAELLQGHSRAWAQLWERFDIDIGSNPDGLRMVRLQLLHLLQTLSPNTAELDCGAPARGLHGEAYRGHIFWDELFVFPALTIHVPTVTRSLLQYRYRRLPRARLAAREAGYVGAMFPWQSGSDGREESPELHLNPRSGRWNPDPSARAHHVGLAVAYNVWQYYQVSGDIDYILDYGAEILAEIARFWVSLATFDGARERYVIRGVIGPDEFHSGYPGRIYEGIDNNAYTNVMAVWVIARAMEALELLPLSFRLDLLDRLELDDAELALWDDVSRRMFVPFHNGVISQFEGYERLAELDWQAYRQRYGNIQRLDRILEAENDSVNNYQASKQADALMLFYLLSSDELRELFERLGYRFTPGQIPKTTDYYLSRTSHGSTLSAIVHSWVSARGNRDEAMKYFQQVLLSDFADVQGGTTFEGIHLAAMAGSVDLLQRCFTGLEFRDDRIVLAPLWPEELGKLAFAFRYRGHRLHLEVNGRAAKVSSDSEQSNVIDIECRGRVHQLRPGRTVEFG